MQNFEQLNSKYFEAFWVACETLNFTKTAKIIHITQSAVTQQIKKLETQLQAQLFVRAQKNLYLTPAGKKLRAFIANYLDNVAELVSEIKEQQAALCGKVRYAMPESCLISPHFSQLLQYQQQHLPQVQLQVEVNTLDVIYEKVAHYEIDFGFVTSRYNIQAVEFTSFCEEEYIWIAHGSRKLSAQKILQQPMIAYPGMEVLYEIWCKQKLPSYPAFSQLKIVGKINHLQGVMDMVSSGMGITLIPKHCLQKYHKNLSQICSGKKVMNTIYIITLENLQQTIRVREIINVFLGMH
ncbi:LysR family transcriptional regulator [Candidatus Uabimicrobium amorphum]|nr:LysR family transcriptional regulator [Candidatus Uabimicrobium amorphum]